MSDAPIEEVLETADIFITTTGNFNIIMAEHMSKMKNNAIVGNIGHFDNEIDMAGVENWPGIKRQNIKPQVDRFIFPDGHGLNYISYDTHDHQNRPQRASGSYLCPQTATALRVAGVGLVSWRERLGRCGGCAQAVGRRASFPAYLSLV